MIDTYPSQRLAALGARVRLLARTMADETHLGRLDAIAARLPEGERGFLAQTPRLREGLPKSPASSAISTPCRGRFSASLWPARYAAISRIFRTASPA